MLHTDETQELIKRGFHAQSLQFTNISMQLQELLHISREREAERKSERVVIGSRHSDKYVELPIKSIEEFLEYDNQIHNEEDFRNETVRF